MNQKELNDILIEHKKWLCDQGGKRANLRGVNLYGADLREANLREADLRGVNLEYCEDVLSFTGGKHLLVYFKHEETYYFKIGCITKTCAEWLSEFETIGKEYKYGENTKLYGDVIKLFSQYDLGEKEGEE